MGMLTINRDGTDVQVSEEEVRAITGNVLLPVPAQRIEWGALIRNMTVEEAAAFDAAVQAAEPRFRWLIQKTAYISTDDPDYPTLKAAFDATFGQERAAELLAPSE